MQNVLRKTINKEMCIKMQIKLDTFHNINKIMRFKIFNLNQCKRVKFQLLNRLHQTQLKLEETETEQVVHQNQKKEKEEDGVLTQELEQIQKDLMLLQHLLDK
jgi:hypothetical protein